MIAEQEQTTLSPEEVGAFATQWAEHRKVGVDELSNLLGVDKSKAESLLRQARGRLHMEAWLADKQPKTPWWQSQWTMVGLAALGGAIVGCLLTKVLMPNPDLSNVRANPLPTQRFKVTTTPPDHADLSARPPRGSGPTPELGTNNAQPHPPVRRGAGMAASPFVSAGGPMTHISQGGAAGASKANVHSYSMFLAASVPKNIVMQLELPGGAYILQGQISKNYRDASGLTDKEIAAGLKIFLAQVLKDRAKEGAGKTPPNGKTGRLLVNVGMAVVSREIPWDATNPAQLQKLVDPSSPLLKEISNSLVGTIQSYGPQLFPRPIPIAPGVTR